MINCQTCGKSYADDKKISFCIQCGSRLNRARDPNISCLQCSNKIVPSSKCPHCGLEYSKTELLLLKEVNSLKLKLTNLSGHDVIGGEVQKLDKATENWIQPDISSIIEADEEIETHTEEEPREVEVSSAPTVHEVSDDDPLDVYPEPRPEVKISKPQLFEFTYTRGFGPKPVDVPDISSSGKPEIKDQTFIQRLSYLVEGPILTTFLVFTSIMTLIFAAEFLGWNDSTQGIIFSFLGLSLIASGFLMMTGNLPLFGTERGLGVFITAFGFLLANIFALGSGNYILILSILFLSSGSLAYIGEKQVSEVLLSLVTGYVLITPIILASQVDEVTVIDQVIGFGGGLLFLLPVTLLTIKAGLDEIGYYPAIIQLAIGSIIGYAQLNNAPNLASYTSLGLVVSLIPIVLLIYKSKVFLIDFYYTTLLLVSAILPLVIYFSNLIDGRASFDPFQLAIFYVGYPIAMSSLMKVNSNETGILLRLKESAQKYVLPALIGLTTLTVLLGDFEISNYIDLVGVIAILMMNFFMVNLVPGIEGRRKYIFDGYLGMLSFGIMSKLSDATGLNDLLVSGIIGLAITISLMTRFYQVRQSITLDDITSVMSNLIVFQIAISIFGDVSSYVVLPLSLLFLIPIVMQNMSDKNRVLVNNALIITQTAAVFFVISGINVEYDAFLLVLAHVVMMIVAAIGLHYFRIADRVVIEAKANESLFRSIYRFTVSNQDVMINLGMHLALFSYIQERFQFEISDPTYLNLLLVIVTPVTMGALYVSRRGHWLSIIPGLATLALSYELLPNKTLVSFIYISYMLTAFLLNYIDHKKEFKRYISRILSRDLVLWAALITMVWLDSQISILIYIMTGLSILNSIASDFFRKKSPISGIGMILGPVALLLVKTDSTLLVLGHASIVLAMVWFIIQDKLVESYDLGYENNPLVSSIVEFLRISDFERYISSRFLLPFLGLTIVHLNTSTELTALLSLSVLSVLVVYAVLSTDSGHHLFAPIIVMNAIILSVLDASNLYDLIAEVAIVASLAFGVAMVRQDRWNFMTTFSLPLLLIHTIIESASATDQIWQILNLSVIAISLLIDKFRDNTRRFASLPVISLVVISSQMVLPNIEVFNFIFILVYAAIDGFKQGEVHFSTDLSIALAVAIGCIFHQDVLSVSAISPFLIMAGIIAVAISQFWQRSEQYWLISAIVISFTGVIIVPSLSQWFLVFYGLHFLLRYMLEKRDVGISAHSEWVPTVFLVSLFFVTEPDIIFSLLIIGVMTIFTIVNHGRINEIIELNFPGIIFASIMVFMQNGVTSSMDFFFIPIYPLLALWFYRVANNPNGEGSDTIRVLRTLGVFLFMFAAFAVAGTFGELSNTLFLGLLLAACISMSYFIWSKTSDLLMDTVTVISLSVSAVLLGGNGALIILGIIIINICYMAVNMVAEVGEVGAEELGIFGFSYILLGAVQSRAPFVIDLDPALLSLFNYSWIVTYLIWIGTAALTVYQSEGITINLELTSIQLRSLADVVLVILAGQGLVMWSWQGLAAIDILVFLSVFMSFAVFGLIILQNRLRVDLTSPIDKLYAGFFTYVISGLFAPDGIAIELGQYSIDAVNIFINLSILPVVFGLIVFTNRGYRNLQQDRINRERLFLYLILAIVVSALFGDYKVGLVPSVYFAMAMFCWTILLIAAWNNDVVLTALGSVFVYTAAYLLGVNYRYQIEDAVFTASIPVVIFIALVVVLYLFRAEFEHRFQKGHHPLLLVSIFALILMSFQTDNFRLIGSSTSVATTIVTVLFSFVGALTYIYGTKFRRGRYQGLGIFLIFLNLFRGLALFLTRIAGLQESTEANPLLSLISFFWASVMIGLVGGIRSLSRRNDLNRVLSAIFSPIDREDVDNE